MWAQRSSLIFLTVCLEDVKDPEIKVEPTKLLFRGVGGTEKKLHEVTVNFLKEIDPDVRKVSVTPDTPLVHFRFLVLCFRSQSLPCARGSSSLH